METEVLHDSEAGYEESSDDEEDIGDTRFQRGVHRVRLPVVKAAAKYRKVFSTLFWTALAIVFYVYFGYCMYKTFNAGHEDSRRFLVVTVVATVGVVWYLIWTSCGADRGWKLPSVNTNSPSMKLLRQIFFWKAVIGTLIFITAYVVVNVGLKRSENLTSLIGIAALVIIPWVGSKHPSRVRWRPVFWGIALQFYLLVVLRWEHGYQAFVWLGERVREFLNHSTAGSLFLFGEKYADHYFAFYVLVIIVYCSAIISVVYHLGVIQFVIKYVAKFLAFCQGTSPIESLAAASNIFFGPGETAMMIQPFVKNLTRAELHAVCTLGMGTIASSVIGAYIAFGMSATQAGFVLVLMIGQFPTINGKLPIPANHILTASIMSAPAGLAISKLFYPDTKRPVQHQKDPYNIPKGQERNIVDALIKGAEMSVGLCAHVAVSFISCLAAIRFLDMTLTWLGHRADMYDPEITFMWVCSYLFYPVAWAIGVPGDECRTVGSLLGTKTVLNEFIAYRDLSLIIADTNTYNTYMLNATGTNNGTSEIDGKIVLNYDNTVLQHGVLSARSTVIAIFSLCGFSNLSCIGMNIGIISAVAPTRRRDASKIMVRAMIAACLTDFMTAAVAGLMYDGQG